MTIRSRLTSKGKTIIPSSVREHLNMEAGDLLDYELQEDAVILRPVRSNQPHESDPFHLFDEWASSHDDEAYADL